MVNSTIGGNMPRQNDYEANQLFLEYEENIVNSPIYAGMPDARREDGSIQWEAPSNRSGGEYQFTHDRRLTWWKNKAAEIGVNTTENHWISKVAKRIHPDKLHPCKACGRVMDIRYRYLSLNFIKRVRALPYYNDELELNELTDILDFIPRFTDMFGSKAFASLPKLLRCTHFSTASITQLNLGENLNAWEEWISDHYVPSEPSMLGPGTMSNAPDRLDGFHSFNRCCRKTADKGRSRENLASYTSDRRAFENWSDGNWIEANQLMATIRNDAVLKTLPCANDPDPANTGSVHKRPCSADHIGPISLGFCHRSEFQLLCTECNSAKNNRMSYNDVSHLMDVEEKGTTVTTWYATHVWQRGKNLVINDDTAKQLSRVMRDNRGIAMQLLHRVKEKGEYLFLVSLLNLDYANYRYEAGEEPYSVEDSYVSAEYEARPSVQQYVDIQKARKIRVAFEALEEYAQKENRNDLDYETVETPEISLLEKQMYDVLATVGQETKEMNEELKEDLSHNDPASYLEEFSKRLTAKAVHDDSGIFADTGQYREAKSFLERIMELVADELLDNWDSTRYVREEQHMND